MSKIDRSIKYRQQAKRDAKLREEKREEILERWSKREDPYEWAWFDGEGRLNRNDEHRGLYYTKEEALAHRPENKLARLHRLDPIAEWVRVPED